MNAMNTTTVPLREYNARALHQQFCQSMANPRCSNLPHRPFDYDVEVLGRLMQRDELLAALNALLHADDCICENRGHKSDQAMQRIAAIDQARAALAAARNA